LPADTPKPPKPRWATIYIGKGKKDKLSKVDIVGFLCKKGGLTGGEIGPVDVREYAAYAAVPRTRLKQLLTLVHAEKIKGMKTVVEEAK
ncbi:MAG: DbpA RNA binding domain-containing protein, partial [Prevotellaceae bacterium]|nr:DbpA RNA binding domain-containing protein [Prevotellaceae bacterium]